MLGLLNTKKEDPKNVFEQVGAQLKKSGNETMLFAGVAAGARTFLVKYAPPIIGFTIGYFFFRLICNALIKEDHPIIQACQKFENKYWWLFPAIMLTMIGYVSPKFADSKLVRNPTFWASIPCGGFVAATYNSKATK